MITKVFTGDLSEAAELIRNGGIVAVPTETVYGLAGNGLDAAAVEKIYEVKGRPARKPLSLMVPDAASMDRYCLDIPPQARTLAESFWPGPLTIVLKARAEIPSVVLAGGDTVGLRCPDHPQTLELLRLTGLPFAAPSANPSGEESPKDAKQVLAYFDGAIDGVVDGGRCGIGRESTLISLAETPYRILRRGALDEETIGDALVRGMTVVGITGPTGAGKSTVRRELEKLGAFVIDCDALYHELLESGGALTAALAERFPVACSGGGIDRKKLAAHVFSDPAELEALNGISHRFVREEVTRLLRGRAMAGDTLAALDAVELIGGGLSGLCDLVLGVLADRQERMERIMRRDGLDEKRAAERLDAQRPDDYFREKCDYILYNNGDKDHFSNICREYFTEVLKKHG